MQARRGCSRWRVRRARWPPARHRWAGGRLGSLPAGKRGVKTIGLNFNDTDAQELDSFAYCGKRKRPPTVASEDVQVALNSFESVEAQCPSGSQAIAGGFGTDQSVITLTSKRSGKRSWKVVGVNLPQLGGSSRPASLSAYAYCKSPGATLVTKSKDITVSSDLESTSVECPNDGKALSGGFDGHVKDTGGQLSAAGALGSKRAMGGSAWTTSAISTSGSNPATITTYAYCRR